MLERFGWAPRRESFDRSSIGPNRRRVNARLRRRKFAFERLEFRRMLATITWDGGAGTLNWNDANNWSTNAIPGAADTAVIPDLTGTPTIVFTTGTRSVGAIQTAESLSISGGSLTVGGNLSGSGNISVSGGTLALAGSNWVNSTSLSLVSGTLNLGGSFVQASLGTFTRSGGTVALIGTLTGNLTLDATTGTWVLGNSGTLKDSQLVSSTPVVVSGTFTLDNVTITNGTELQVLTGSPAMSVRNGLTINGRLSVGSATTSGSVAMANTQTIAGSGDILFSTASNAVSASTSGLTITYGPALTLHGKNVTFSGNTTSYVFQGLVGPDVAAGVFTFNSTVTSTTILGHFEPSNGSTIAYSGTTLTNNGHAVVTASNTLRLNPSGAFINNGSITSTGGALTVGGLLNNLGTISVTNTDVTLAGAFTQFALGSATPAVGQGTFTRSGGSVLLTAILTGNLTLDAATGTWVLGNSGTLKDSQLVSSTPVVVSGTFTLDNVTITNGTELQVLTGSPAMSVRNGLTINGRLSVGSATISGSVAMANTQTIAGSGDILFSTASNAVSVTTAGLTITYGPALTLHGKNVTFSGNTTSYVFQGLVGPDVAAGVFTFGSSVTSTTILGRLEPSNGSTITYSGITLTNNGQANITASNTLRLNPSGAFINNGSITSTGGALTVGGLLNNLGTISVTNTDVTLAGAFTQFALGSATPAVGQGTFTRSGGTVLLTALLTGNLTLDTATGTWLLGNSGTLKDSQLVANIPVVVSGTFTLDNVTITSGTELQVLTGSPSMSVRNGLTINGRLAVGSATTSGSLAMANTQTIAGSGDILFSTASNAVSVTTSGLTITYGPALTLHGKNVTFSGNTTSYVFQGLVGPDVAAGVFIFNSSVTSTVVSGRMEPSAGSTITYSGTTLTNNGQMVVTASNTLRLTSTGAFVNNSSITSTGGVLTVGGLLNNLGTISVTNTDVTLAGAFTQFALGSATPAVGQGTFTRSGGTVLLTALLTGNLTLDAATGPWLLGGSGTLKDSQLVSNTTVIASAAFTFNNVTITTGTDVEVQTPSMSISNGLTINGRLLVGTATKVGILSLTNTQTIAGSGEIVFSGAVTNGVSPATIGLTITFGPSLTLRGKTVNFSGTSTTYVLHGLIQPDVAGAVFNFNSTGTVTNQGRILSSNSTTVSLTPTTFTNNGTLEVTAGGRMDVRPTTFSNFTNLTSDSNTFTTTLSGGTYKVADTGVLRLYPSTLPSTVFRITRLAADLSLNGAAAQLTGATGNYNYDALRELTSIEPTGRLSVLGGKSFEPFGSFTQRGELIIDATSRLGLPIGPAASNGLISSYSAENNAADTAGSNPGTLVGGATFTTGISGSAFSFDGIDDYVSIADSTSLRPASTTIEGWFRFSATPSGNDTLFSKIQSVSSVHSFRLYTQGAGSLFYNMATANGFISMNPEVGVWHHVALAFDTNVDITYLYVDGIQKVAANASAIGYSNLPLLIGATQFSTTTFIDFFTGSIDEVRVYDRALTAAEIRNQYSQYAATRMNQAAGTSSITGNLTGSPDVTLSGGTLKGTGTIPTNLNQTGGQLAPGNSPGCLTINGNYNLSGGALQAEVDGPNVCTQYDQLRVNGTVTLDGSLSLVLAPAYVPIPGQEFTIIENDSTDAVVGGFIGLPEKQVFIANSTQIFQISYTGGTGNDVVLKYLGSGAIVSTTAATGPGSLSDAITVTNGRVGAELIAFGIPSAQAVGGVYSLALGSAVLPAITDTLVLDASTQREYIDRPIIELTGDGSAIGLNLQASGVQIRGLAMTSWNTAINVSFGNTSIAGNFLGLKADGSVPSVSNNVGIVVSEFGVATIGGTTTLDRNVISGNQTHGIRIENSNGNVVSGNFIGTNVDGNLPLPNQVGIKLQASSRDNLIGGLTSGTGNVISGNSGSGVEIDDSDANTVQGNIIGLTHSGAEALGNAIGITLTQTASINLIGGTQSEARNIISGNLSTEILINNAAFTNSVQGNYIGTNAAGTAAQAVSLVAISIYDLATDNRIGSTNGAGRNLIVGAGLGSTGIAIANADANLVDGNWLGLNAAGSAPLGYFGNGISLQAADNNSIGTESTGVSNVIVQYGGHGITLFNGSDGNRIYASYIGVGPSGNEAMFSESHSPTGIAIDDSANTIVGGVTRGNVSAGNVISGNGTGLRIAGAGSINTQIYSNRIGVNASGSAAIPNDFGFDISGPVGTIIGGLGTGQANTISGNSIGILIRDASINTRVTSNLIGLTTSGSTTPGIPNTIYGIEVQSGVGTLLTDNHIVRSGSTTAQTNNDGVRVLGGDVILQRNLIHDNLGPSISVNEPPGLITLSQARVDGFALGTISLATPNTAFTLEFFAATMPGQAEQYIGTSAVVTDADGTASFEVAGLGDLPPAKYLTATITGPRIEGDVIQITSPLAAGVIPTSAIIRGLPTRAPEGRPISLKAFAVGSTVTGYAVTGYVWNVHKDGQLFASSNEAGVQFAPDDEGSYAVTLTLIQTNAAGDQQQVVLGPHTITIVNVAPTPQFEITPTGARSGQPITLTSDSSDPGQLDVVSHAWTVRSGSPSGPIVFSQPTSAQPAAATATFTPTSGGIYFATLTVDDNDGGPAGSRSLTRQIEVLGLAQSISIVAPAAGSEGQTVRARAPESELRRAEQLNFAWQVQKRTAAGVILQANYPFTEPARGAIEFVPNDDGVYRILLSISEVGNSVVNISAPPADLVVTNTSPIVTILTPTTTGVVGSPVNLNAIISEPRTIDSFTTTWSMQRNGRDEPGLGTVGSPDTSFSFTPLRGGVYTITAVTTDDDYDNITGIGRGTARQVIIVPESNFGVVITGPASSVTEGTTAQFTAVISGGTPASYAWTVRDANSRLLTVFSQSGSGSTVPAFAFAPPQGGRFLVELEVTLTDTRSARSSYVLNNVNGLAPTIDALTVVAPASNVVITEGMTVTVRASASDAGETRGLAYRWQLARPGQAFVDFAGVATSPTDLSFVPTDDGIHTVRVFVTDSQGLTSQSDLSITVANAAPSARLAVTNVAGATITFAAIAIDAGTEDQSSLTYDWSINGGSFVATGSNAFTTTLSGPTLLVARVTDDTTATLVRYYLLVGSSGNDIVSLTPVQNADAIALGADTLAYLGLDGDDQITAQAGITLPLVIWGNADNDTINTSAINTPVDLDGGTGNDTLISGNGEDTLRAGTGTNVLVGGNGRNRFVGGGNDTMTGGIDDDNYEVHFSTVVVNDVGGGFDTIDLNAAPSGVTLDFSSTAGAAQNVFPTSSPVDSFHDSTLALNGSFQKLIGSPYGDVLSASTAGVEIQGGSGNDQLSSSGTDMQLDGGVGDDTLVLQSTTGTFSGGDGNDTFVGAMNSSSLSIIDTGPGDDVVQVAGPTTGNKAPVVILGSTGSNQVTASNVTGKIFAEAGSTTAGLVAFGSISSSGTTLNTTITNSVDIDIFGAQAGNSTVNVNSSQDVDIFGSGNDQLTLTNVTRATIDGGLFGSVSSSTATLNTTITNSVDIDIFGASTVGSNTSTTVIGSQDIDIFGAPRTNTIFVGSSQDIDIFGVSEGSVTFGSNTSARVERATLHISDFGVSTASPTLSTNVINSTDVDIFGSVSSSAASLNLNVNNSTDIDIFGANARNVSMQVGSSQDIGIFGVLDGSITLGPTNPATAGQGVQQAIIEASSFGASNLQLSVNVNNSVDVDIFGARTSSGSVLHTNVNNSVDIGIFGASTFGGNVQVNSSQDIDIFAQASAVVGLNGVSRGTIFTQVFGASTVNSPLALAVTNNSVDIDIFGAPNRNADISVTNSVDIDIFGGNAVTSQNSVTRIGDRVTIDSSRAVTIAAGIFGSVPPAGSTVMTLTVQNNSVDIDIFGSSAGRTQTTVISSQDIDIFGAYGDQVDLQNAQRVRVEGGVFGSVSTSSTGLTLNVQGNSTDIDIFGSSIADSVTLTGGTRVRTSLRDGSDQLSIAFVNDFAAIADAGDDQLSIQSGTNIFIYAAAGRDQVTISGGTNIRVIGAEDADEFLVRGGSTLDIDGGNGADIIAVVDGSDLAIRSDAGDDVLRLFRADGAHVSGGDGNESIQLFGSTGTAITAGETFFVIDGQAGNDTLSVQPLMPNAIRVAKAAADPLEGLPTWMLLPGSITSPLRTLLPSSVALIGGIGNDLITLEGNQKLYGLGGDGNDTIRLLSGHRSALAGGAGDDTLSLDGGGIENLAFGDAGNDTIDVLSSLRTTVFGEEDDDTITTQSSIQASARGGVGQDTLRALNSDSSVLSGESGSDTITILSGQNNLGAGGPGPDQLEVNGGSFGLLLGEQGNDTLTFGGGSASILSGGDGDDTLIANSRDGDLYGDDGDDQYDIRPTSSAVSSPELRLHELQFIDRATIESESRGSDTIDLAHFNVAALLDLGLASITQPVINNQLTLFLRGAFENIFGTSANDTLIGTAQSNAIDGGAGDDQIFAMSGDDTLTPGPGNDTIEGGAGDDHYIFGTVPGGLGNDTLREAIGGGTDWLDFSRLSSAGLGTLNLNLSSPQLLNAGEFSLTLQKSSVDSSAGAFEDVTGTLGPDTIIGNTLDNRFEGLAGNDTLSGGDGSDIYVFGSGQLGDDFIDELSSNTGRDTLDFTSYGGPLNLDLALNVAQNLGSMTLTLSSGSSVENLIGTSFDDVLLGNGLNNSIYGAAGADRIEGRAGDDLLVADLPQVVLLDFDSAFNATRGDYNYSIAERNEIQSRMVSDYAAFGWIITQNEAAAQAAVADMGQSMVRIVFSEGRGGGVSGDAGEVDFRNLNRQIVSQVNINPLKDVVREILGPSATPAQYSAGIVALTANIASHELAHTAGVRHGDAFGPIGTGLYNGADLSRIFPTYTGPLNANETPRHIIASPASVGTTIADAMAETYFGAREAIKLAFNEIGRTRLEFLTARQSHNSIATAEDLGSLSQLYVPNLAPATGAVYSGKTFDVTTTAVVGQLEHNHIAGSTETDFYRFSGRQGEVVNIELLANSIRPLRGTGFDGRLQIFNSSGALVAENDDDFEGTLDATLVDVILPADGAYYVAVSLSPQPATVELGGRYELFLSRFRVLPEGATLPAAVGDTLIGGAGADRLRGGAADDMFLATDSAIGDLADEYLGGNGNDTLDLLGLDYAYTLPIGHSIENIVNANIAPTATLTGVPTTALAEGAQITLSLTAGVDPSIADTTAGFRYGFILRASDGSVVSGSLPTTYLSASAFNSVTFSLPDNDDYQIVARILDQQNGIRDYSATISTTNVAPIGTLSGPSTASQGNPTTYSVTASDASSVDSSTLRFSFGSTLAELATTYNAAASSSSGAITFANLGNQTAYARILDKDGGQVTLQQAVNVSVTAALDWLGPSQAAVGQPLSFQISAAGLPADAHYSIAWGDGNSITQPAGLGVTTVSTRYLSPSGPAGYTIDVSARTATGTVLASLSRTIVVTQLLVVTENSLDVLYGGGTSEGDAISVRRITANTFGITFVGSPEQYFGYGPSPVSIDRIVLFGLGGNDKIEIAADLNVPAEIFGGDGNDSLRGGAGHDVLVGGPGNDQLTGNAGSDVMIGGGGRDTLQSLGDGDLMIAGLTSYDADVASLAVLSNYWSSNATDNSLSWYQTRIATVSTIGISGVQLVSATMQDDNVLDTLSGEVNAGGNPARKFNWYIQNVSGSGVKDSLQRNLVDEVISDL